MHDLLAGLVAIAAGVLLAAGAAKVARPDTTMTALTTLVPRLGARAPGTTGAGTGRSGTARTLATGLGGAEIVLAAAVLASSHRAPTAALAVAFAAFAVVAEVLRRRGAIGCGCFGTASASSERAPVTGVHVAVDLVLAVVAAAGAAAGAGGLLGRLGDLPAAGVPTVLTVVAGAAGVVGLLTVWPEARAAAAVLRDADPRREAGGGRRS